LLHRSDDVIGDRFSFVFPPHGLDILPSLLAILPQLLRPEVGKPVSRAKLLKLLFGSSPQAHGKSFLMVLAVSSAHLLPVPTKPFYFGFCFDWLILLRSLVNFD
jgi:hypothetical protein